MSRGLPSGSTQGQAAIDAFAEPVPAPDRRDARAIVSLGSNIEAREHLAAALRLLAARSRLIAVSRIFETEPALGARGPAFLNAAAMIETELSPAELKFGLLRGIEGELGRIRLPDKNAPRTIDLDVALYGDRVIDLPDRGIRIPDPDLLAWPHVALPAADLAPDWVHPEDGRRLAEIAAGLEGGSGIRTLGADAVALPRLAASRWDGADAGHRLDGPGSGQTSDGDSWRERVLDSFLVRGRLVRIPARRKKRRVILEHLVERFEPERDYPEAELNRILADYHDDVATLRRELVVEGLMVRARGVYRRLHGSEA
ncbi:MAG: 2-amino-4-hydroxy-6-hydroxymethyldihydropteridine diphosphokinase [Caldilineae bacterium]|nr:2-amino-4-hydroxy-6-hydroxymethyldihydropteridine diphosphokinase [Caldilineae bacterium]